MRKYTINDKVRFAIFGVPAEDEGAFEAQIAAERAETEAKDRAMAVAMAEEANRTMDYGPAEGAVWEAALFYDHPRAIARVEGVVYCYQKRGLYYPLSDVDAAEAVTYK